MMYHYPLHKMTDKPNNPISDGHIFLVDKMEEEILRSMIRWYANVMKHQFRNMTESGSIDKETVEKILEMWKKRGLLYD